MIATKTIAKIIKAEMKRQQVKKRKNIGYRKIARVVRLAIIASLRKQRKQGNVIQLARRV